MHSFFPSQSTSGWKCLSHAVRSAGTACGAKSVNHLHGAAVLIALGPDELGLLFQLQELVIQMHHKLGVGAAATVLGVLNMDSKVVFDGSEIDVRFETGSILAGRR